ncbi:MAG: radical SAM protein [Methyloprofundus sp.]|nr:radical SAM protein [Methyloprofundus sp.]
MSQLTVKNHNRDVIGFKYIYPVISRRSGGLSIGINFNTNNACNWACVYCQVPDLSIGAAPEVDLGLLARELSDFLQDVLHGDFYDRFEIERDKRVIKDIAISGNGEPTSVKKFNRVLQVIIERVEQANIPDPFQYVLITNGSLMHKPDVQKGLQLFNRYKGQVWFKVDTATEAGRSLINQTAISTQQQQENLMLSASLCATWVQTCVLSYAGHEQDSLLSKPEQAAYLVLLEKVLQNTKLEGVMLYSVARPSLQAQANSISSVKEAQLEEMAGKVRLLGLQVRVSV